MEAIGCLVVGRPLAGLMGKRRVGAGPPAAATHIRLQVNSALPCGRRWRGRAIGFGFVSPDVPYRTNGARLARSSPRPPGRDEALQGPRSPRVPSAVD